MGDMDKLAKMGLPISEGSFSHNKNSLLNKGALSEILNSVQSQLLKGNLIRNVSVSSLSAAGGTISMRMGGIWVGINSEWEITANGLACTPDFIIRDEDEEFTDILSLTTPALTAGHTVQLKVFGKKTLGGVLEYVGSIWLPVV